LLVSSVNQLFLLLPSYVNENQRTYLQGLFNIGVQTRQKFDPKQVEKMMRSEKTHNEQRFEPEEYLKAQQIASYFSRYARQQKEQPIQEVGVEPMEDEVAAVPNEPEEEAICGEDYLDEDEVMPSIEEELHDYLIEETECFEVNELPENDW
jgi:hypothetical protein